MALAICLVFGQLPWLGTIAGLIPWYMRDLALPAAIATILGVIRIEGRPFHLAAQALLRHRLGPRRLSGDRRSGAVGERWWPPDIVLLPDGSDGRIRHMRYRGPGAVLIAVEHARVGARRGTPARCLGRLVGRADVTVEELAGARSLTQAQVIALGPRAEMLVRPSHRPQP